MSIEYAKDLVEAVKAEIEATKEAILALQNAKDEAECLEGLSLNWSRGEPDLEDLESTLSNFAATYKVEL